MDFEKLAQLLFPDVDKTPSDYESAYPERKLPAGARVTRIAPSPTGYLHIGTLFAALISERAAHQSGGVFFLRIEDTDSKREVEGGVTSITEGLKNYGILFDEGMTGENTETGAYGPYTQSERVKIYQCYAKELVKKGLAYPCFCSEERLSKIREEQEQKKDLLGYWGEYAQCRNLNFEEIESKVMAEEKFVTRLRSPGKQGGRISFIDGIKGEIEMDENIVDIVLLKSDGIPTYHFAHAVDDHLMRTTDVMRGDEWVSSVPIHLQLFSVLGFKPPKYSHISPIMKIDGDSKRKISKRLDPEAAVSFYWEQGYPKDCVMEYLLNIANSSFEGWREKNPEKHWREYPFDIKRMSVSGALFDIAKLNDVSRELICRYDAARVYDEVCCWASEFDHELYTFLTANPQYAKEIFSIERGGEKPRKDISRWNEVRGYLSYFYDELFDRQYEWPDNIAKEDIQAILGEYTTIYEPEDDRQVWFDKIKELSEKLGFAREVKFYKKDPASFKGHCGDVATVIRVAITGRRQTPDLNAVLRVLGKEEVINRLKSAL